jgi:hypothetical protein
MRVLRKSQTRNVVVFMTDSSDHISGKTGLTLAITASKDGASFASITPTVTELTNGWYKLALTASHTDTLGDLALHITATGADTLDFMMEVKDFEDKVNTINTSTSYLPSQATSWPSSVADDDKLALLTKKVKEIYAVVKK